MASKRLNRIGEVQQKTGKSRTAIYEDVAAGTFPAPMKIGKRSSAWLESEIDAWIEARIAERDAHRGAA